MTLGAKLKLGFIDGSCVNPASDSDYLQRWHASYGKRLGKDMVKAMLKKCWDELQNLNGMPTCNCGKMRECTCSVLEKFALRDSNSKLIQFLMKLNDEYESVRSQILTMDPLLTVNKAYYIVHQIEKQKQVTNHVFEPSAFFANMKNKNNSSGRRDNNKGNINENKRETSRNDTSYKKVCTGCGQEGHLFEQCFERLGYPDWYKGKKAKKNSRIVAHVIQDLMSISVEKHHFIWGILSLFTASFALFCHPNMDLFLDCVSDTGASDHMSPHLNLFISIKHLKTPIIVHLPDERSKTVTIVGQVQLTPSLILTDVFYVPDFQLNLLSVGKFIKTKQLAAHFYLNNFMFQDLTTKQIVVVGKGSQCLYIFKPTLAQVTFDAQLQDTSIAEAKLSYRGSTSVASMYQICLMCQSCLLEAARTSYSLPPVKTGYSLPPEGTNYSLPPEGTSCSLPPAETGYSLPPEGTSCSLPLKGTSYSLVIASGHEVAFVTPTILVNHSNMEWFCLRNIRS
ncbi:retrovirus-related pol polyprotein from transposon TNT 1-94 [Tanacetum coccineum]